jgi:CDP-paratose synthetase
LKHVLLTGATGFLGSHLLEALLEQGYKVSILKRSTSNLWRIKHRLEQIKAYNVDQVVVDVAFKGEKIDAVLHTACSYGRNGQSIHEIVEANLVFGLKVLDAANRFETEAFINTDTLLSDNLNVYALSKRQFSEWLQRGGPKIKAVNLRLEHMYGPKDDQTKLVPWFLQQLEAGVSRIPLTNGSQQRDFIYIDDVVSAYLLVLQKLEQLSSYTEFDVGTGNTTSVRTFVTKLYHTYKTMNPNTTTELGFGDIPMRDGESMSVKVDNAAIKRLGWYVRTQQAIGIENLFRRTK